MLNPGPALLRGRAAAQAIMQDACSIVRLGAPVTDPDLGTVTKPTTSVYTGQCRLQVNSKNARPNVVGEDQLFLFRVQLQLPITAVGIQIDDQATVTTSLYDPELVGRVFVIREVHHGTHITSRRLMCEEVIL